LRDLGDDPPVQAVRPLPGAWRAGRAALAGQLPDHYAGTWRDEFDRRVAQALTPDCRVLDVGAGRSPTIPPADRSAGCHYAGLDLSAAELEHAPVGWYDEVVVGDVSQRAPGLAGRFDLVVSFQVLEHVKPLARALENLRSYLAPGGCLVAQLSGAYSVFGVANRLVPHSVATWLLEHLLDRPPATVFPAHYDGCSSSQLRAMLRTWADAEVHPEWWGAGYFAFSRPLRAAYIGFEEWLRLAGCSNLAPYYVIEATA